MIGETPGAETLTSTTTPLWLKLLDRYGFPTLIAGVFMWIFVVQLQAALKDFAQAQANLGKSLEAHANQMEKDQIEHRFYLRMLCVNTARTQGQQTMCGQTPQGR